MCRLCQMRVFIFEIGNIRSYFFIGPAQFSHVLRDAVFEVEVVSLLILVAPFLNLSVLLLLMLDLDFFSDGTVFHDESSTTDSGGWTEFRKIAWRTVKLLP